MTLEIVGAGFGRTGTLSMKAALERLGFGPCYHMAEVIANPPFAAHWMAAADGVPVDWDVVFKGYSASVDWPGCAFYRQQAAHYPKAKVILTVRDMNNWYDSCISTIFQIMLMDLALAPPYLVHVARLARKLIATNTFADHLLDREHCIAVHQAHIEDVKRTIAPERLLVFQVSEGWDPLCRFLGVPVPDEPFPRVNERENFGKDLPGGKG
ncbi:MAG: sulfotransferase [Alphaproteobacteria bacterium]|nr:sulfotransferase [Alphaproteobacteria bacterium]